VQSKHQEEKHYYYGRNLTKKKRLKMSVTQQQLNRFFEILKASKLPSELVELINAPSTGHYVVIQSGESDAQKISVSKLRGALGSYDVTTNTPTLTDGAGVEGDSYIATTAGTRDFGSGNVSISVDDILEYRNGKWLVNGLALTQGRVVAALGYTPLDKSTYTGTAQDLKDDIDKYRLQSYTDFNSFPAVGSVDVIYKDESDLALYLWDDVNEVYVNANPKHTATINSIADLKTFTAHDTDSAVELLGYYTKGDGGGGSFYWDAASTEADNGGTIIQVTGVTTGRWKRRFSGAVNVKWFGVKYDGTDETEKFNKAIANGGIVTGDGEICISSSLTTSEKISLIGENLTIKAISVVSQMFSPLADFEIKGVTFNGNNLAETGIKGVSNCKINGVKVYNIQSSSVNSSYGIYCSLSNYSKGGIYIENCKIESITHTTTSGTIGDSEGAARAITVKLFGNSNDCFVSINNNVCIDVFGQEGDSVHISDENLTGKNKFVITKNEILRFNRRGIKLQASNVIISNNTIEDVDGLDARAIEGKHIIECASNNLTNILIESNVINNNNLASCIYAVVSNDVVINNNILNIKKTNTVNPMGIWYFNVENLIISNNILNLTDAYQFILDYGTIATTTISIVGNLFKSTGTTAVTVLGISADSFGLKLSNNTLQGNIENFVSSSKNLTGFLIENNTLKSTKKGRMYSLTGTLQDVYFLNNYIEGTHGPFPDDKQGIKINNNRHKTLSREKNILETTNYTLLFGDRDKYLIVFNPITITVPSGLFEKEDLIEIYNISSGDVTVLNGSGMTLNYPQSINKIKPYGIGNIRFSSSSVGGLSINNGGQVNKPLKTVSTTTYTLVSEDATKWLRFTNASGCTVTVPDAVFTAEQELMGDAQGGNVVFSEGTGMTIDGSTTLLIDGIFKGRFRAANEIVLSTGADTNKANVRLDNIAADLSIAEQDAIKEKIGAPNSRTELVNTSRFFTQADKGKILVVSATVTLTMPSTGLTNDWSTDIDCMSTGQATIAKDAGAVVLDSPHGKILEADKMGTVYRKPVGTYANEYRLRGEFKV
jgi:hypothetical protein